ncbi:MAG: hypothetical protein MNPFHGCM_00561 [Gemmatimonadaceae bacterium]|nr:hypothetical protein [Gemmatimonadaceae bacterium]
MRFRRLVGLVGASLALAGSSLGGQTSANDSVLEARTRAISSLLRCPVCQGESIQDSPSELSAQMRDVVRDQLRAGRTDEEVKQYFVDRYGEWILLEPKPRGANLLLYFAPVLLVGAGFVVVWRAVRRWSAGAATATGTPPESTESREH